jgi:K+-transporting ATPase KdpF subunit
MTLDLFLGGLCALVIVGYLLVALLRPEWF